MSWRGAILAAALCAVAVPLPAQQVSTAPGAVLRGLDKVSGSTADITLAVGDSAEFGRLTITLAECRYPSDNPAGNAFAWISIREDGAASAIFEGWMIADSPALNALDHARYDIWLLRCLIPS